MILTGTRRCQDHLYREFFEQADPYGIRSCGPMDTVIDVGAHCGMFSLMARFLMPSARIIAVEPDPGNFQALTTNVMGLNIEFQCVALGNGELVAVQNRASTLSQRYDSAPGATIASARLPLLWEWWNPTGRVFLKMDTEGAERYVMGDSDAERCLESCESIGMELHAFVGSPTIADYRAWLQDRFSSAFNITFLSTRHRHRFLTVHLQKKEVVK